jgi:aminopeptidase
VCGHEEEAQRRLLDEVLWFCRLGPDDPPGFDGWTRHVEMLAARARALTGLRLERLELRGPGTELTVRLAPTGRWLGGRRENAQGVMLVANVPTEESFTSPDPAGTEGTFRCSRPLGPVERSLQSCDAEGHSLHFRPRSSRPCPPTGRGGEAARMLR